MTEYFVSDMEYELMSHCLRRWGTWWATHFWPNRAAREMYRIYRRMPLDSLLMLMRTEQKRQTQP